MHIRLITYYVILIIQRRYSTRVELDLNAVERIVEYLDIPQEPPAIIESNRPPAYWPSKTTKNPMLEVRDLEIRYAPELPSVLNGISFALRAGERIGLLGRTGSGKSTLTMSLLRFVGRSFRAFDSVADVESRLIRIKDLSSWMGLILRVLGCPI